MKKPRTLEQILKFIASGQIPQELYDKYLANTEIGFMRYEDLKEYFNIPKPRTEQEILKEFEDLGYEIETHNEMFYLKKGKYYIAINKENKTYKAFYQDYKSQLIDKTDYRKVVYYQPKEITLKEHKLLNELFECWGWI